MTIAGFILSALAALCWVITLCLPWQPWRTREVLEVDEGATAPGNDLSDITVVIPARDEAEVIDTTLKALAKQGNGLKIILVDDESSDRTAEIARLTQLENLSIIRAKPLRAGWTGKLWAQQQGLRAVDSEYTLLLDADIELLPGIIFALKTKLKTETLQFVSLMAELRFASFWEKLLMPAFIYFFKMLYPFALANRPGHKIAAAAGGCILVNTEVLKQIGGMQDIKDAVIDDCSLAKKVKQAGHDTWIGLSHAVVSQRSYVTLAQIWDMVARTAYTQLNYSFRLLLACTMIMVLLYWLPIFGLLWFQGLAQIFCLLALAIMVCLYLPTLQYYALSPLWSLAMPVIAGMYLMMTWTSVIRFWQGERSRWKGRVYQN